MNEHTQLLARYQTLRKVGMGVNHTLVSRLSKDVLDEGGQKLGIRRDGILVFGSEDEMTVLMDFCIHDIRRGGLTAVERFLAEAPYPPGSDELVFLEALKGAYFSLFLVEAVEPGLGVHVRDLVRDDVCRIVDVGFSRSGHPGLVVASRVLEPEGIAMTGGAALPLGELPRGRGAGALQELAESARGLLRSGWTPERRSEAVAALIRDSLQAGASSHIAYGEPGVLPPSPEPGGSALSSRARRRQMDRYALCPCGSGKKFKFCCGARR